MFNLVGPVDGADVLDLFAGSGAIGLEALSRGAASATFVESESGRVPRDQREPRQARPARDRALPGRGPGRGRRSAAGTTSCSATRPTSSTARGSTPHLGALLRRDGLLVLETAGREPRRPRFPGSQERTSRRYGAARLTLFEL